jgi:hypothetical protein
MLTLLLHSGHRAYSSTNHYDCGQPGLLIDPYLELRGKVNLMEWNYMERD